jgi:hypothetical protein
MYALTLVYLALVQLVKAGFTHGTSRCLVWGHDRMSSDARAVP